MAFAPPLQGTTILIANRGECACRIIKTCKALGVKVVGVYMEQDAQSNHVMECDDLVKVSSYVNIEEIVQAAKSTNADAVLPGYGFLAENADFAKALEAEGVKFCGPSVECLDIFGDKHKARKLAAQLNIPTVPGSPVIKDLDDAIRYADALSYPLLIKASAGGGGIGIFLCKSVEDLKENYQTAMDLGAKYFANADVFLEKFVEGARHVEVQVFGDGKGNVTDFGERECSVQRRNQKLIEECPSPSISEEFRSRILRCSRDLCSALKYECAGTVEFVVDSYDNFYFIECNPRLQVEHGVTEMVYGIDIVELMLRQINEKTAIPFEELERMGGGAGHAIQVRVYAEDALNDFRPCPGVIYDVEFPTHIAGSRFDSWVMRGTEITPFYDSLIVKILQWDRNRGKCIETLLKSMSQTKLTGTTNLLDFLTQFVATEDFRGGHVSTSVLESFNFVSDVVQVLSPGLQSTVQDYPGRTKQGLWRIGVPPSGPMDHLSLRTANRVVGNPNGASALEFCTIGPKLRFLADTVIAVAGATFSFTLNGEDVPMYTPIAVKGGDVVEVGKCTGEFGLRCYLAVRGGFDVPSYLGSRSTFLGGKFGGFQGRTLRKMDSIKFGYLEDYELTPPKAMVQEFQPELTTSWTIGVLPGPQAAPDYFQEEDMEMFYSTTWKVHHNTNRLGVRLIGPPPKFARSTGGEGGSHPSNIHDNVYAIGTVNFTGDMPIVIGHDGPSLGGFVCPATIVVSEIWKIGQVKPNDTILFKKMTIEEAYLARLEQDVLIKNLEPSEVKPKFVVFPSTNVVLYEWEKKEAHPGGQIRLAGEEYILVEYGPMTLDLNLRVRIHFLEKYLLENQPNGILESAPGVRSLQIRYDDRIISLQHLIDFIIDGDSKLPDVTQTIVNCRTLYLPMSFDYPGVNMALEKYMQSVRPEAPYLPSNIEYIAKNNGLSGIEEVEKKVFSAAYMCLGLGDVYLGASCAVPVDPRNRVVTTKMNPARTYTQEGTVGLGGSYMCIYPMDSPGGYQLVGRTLPIWNSFGVKNALFSKDAPWLLRMFDKVRFFPVTPAELDEMRAGFKSGRYNIKVEASTFNLAEYNALLAEIDDEVQAYKKQQTAASTKMLEEEEASLARLKKLAAEKGDSGLGGGKEQIPDEAVPIATDITANVWNILVKAGDKVKQNDEVLVLEAMKMEISVTSPISGTVHSIRRSKNEIVQQGDVLMYVIPDASP